MTVKELKEALDLQVYSGQEGLNKNVMAIASLKDLAAVILVKGFKPEDDMAAQSNEEGIPVLGTSKQAFEITGEIYKLLQK